MQDDPRYKQIIGLKMVYTQKLQALLLKNQVIEIMNSYFNICENIFIFTISFLYLLNKVDFAQDLFMMWLPRLYLIGEE